MDVDGAEEDVGASPEPLAGPPPRLVDAERLREGPRAAEEEGADRLAMSCAVLLEAASCTMKGCIFQTKPVPARRGSHSLTPPSLPAEKMVPLLSISMAVIGPGR